MAGRSSDGGRGQQADKNAEKDQLVQCDGSHHSSYQNSCNDQYSAFHDGYQHGIGDCFVFSAFLDSVRHRLVLWTIVSFMLSKPRKGAWIILSLNVLDTMVLFSGIYCLSTMNG